VESGEIGWWKKGRLDGGKWGGGMVESGERGVEESGEKGS